MSDDLKQEQQIVQQPTQHPYQQTQEYTFVCQPGDRECVSRLVQAFSDCD